MPATLAPTGYASPERIRIAKYRIRQKQAALKTHVQDLSPAFFWRQALGVEHLYPKQLEIPESVLANRRTSVVGCNSSGKDWTSGRVVLWWLWRWYHLGEPAKVVIIGPTTRQVEEIVWREARLGFNRAKLPLPGRMMPRAAKYELSDEAFAIGFATDDEYSLTGYHSPHLLAIVTEAHAVEQGHIDSVKRLNPERILLTGNPFSTGGEFYDSHHDLRELYHQITISAFDTPNVIERRIVIPGMVTYDDVLERQTEWGEDNPLYIAGVKGEFPEVMDGSLLPMSAALGAQARYEAWVRGEWTPDVAPSVLSIDVARGGLDKTVAYHRAGQVARVVYRKQGTDLMSTVGFIQEYRAGHKLDAIVVDGTGLGAGVVDRLRELGIPCIDFQAGANAIDTKRFANRIAECWWHARQAVLAEWLAFEPDKATVGQLVTRKYTVQSDKRIKLESKDDIRKDGRRSPDEADALAMSFSVLSSRSDLDVPTEASSAWGRVSGGLGSADDQYQGGSRWLGR